MSMGADSVVDDIPALRAAIERLVPGMG
jgi:hypothetical protein